MNIYTVLSVIGCVCAVFDIAVNLLILLKIKMHFNCNIYAAQYIMATCVLLDMASGVLTDARTIAVFFVSILVYVIITAVFYTKGVVFFRIFGLKYKMHDNIKDKLAQIAEKNNLNRTNIYIYGGDSKTPCNTLVFRKTNKSIMKTVLKELQIFLRKYTSPNFLSLIFALFLDIAVIYVLCFVF